MINLSLVSTASLALGNEFHGPSGNIGDVIGGVLGCPPNVPGMGGNIGDVIGGLLGCPGDVHIPRGEVPVPGEMHTMSGAK